MCLIIVKPPNAVIPEDILRNGFDSNSDGAGYMYSLNHLLIIKKGIFDVDQLCDEVLHLPSTAPVCVHFRLSTGGKRDTVNCHPFFINDSIAVMHNGTFSDYKPTEFSDTWQFTEKVLKKLPTGFMENPGYKMLLDEYCTHELSKLVFLDNIGRITILNESAGSWENGIWLSSRVWGFKSSYYQPQACSYCGHNTVPIWSCGRLVCPDCSAESFTGLVKHAGYAGYSEFKQCDFCGLWRQDTNTIDNQIICHTCVEEVISEEVKCDWCSISEKPVLGYNSLTCKICGCSLNLLSVYMRL